MKVRGVVKGKTIDLDEATDLADGQGIEVEISKVENETKTNGNVNGHKGAWTYLRLPDDKFRSLSEVDLSEVKIKVTVVNADD